VTVALKFVRNAFALRSLLRGDAEVEKIDSKISAAGWVCIRPQVVWGASGGVVPLEAIYVDPFIKKSEIADNNGKELVSDLR